MDVTLRFILTLLPRLIVPICCDFTRLPHLLRLVELRLPPDLPERYPPPPTLLRYAHTVTTFALPYPVTVILLVYIYRIVDVRIAVAGFTRPHTRVTYRVVLPRFTLVHHTTVGYLVGVHCCYPTHTHTYRWFDGCPALRYLR